MPVPNKMIVVEDKFKALFDQLPLTTNKVGSEFKTVFGYGDEKELYSFLDNNRRKLPYPLIWYLHPVEEEHTRTDVQLKDAVLVLATITTTNKTNAQRMETSFKEVLIPLFDNIKTALMRSNVFDVKGQDLGYKVTKFFNYGDEELVKSQAIDVWDAMRVRFDCSVNSRCTEQIKI